MEEQADTTRSWARPERPEPDERERQSVYVRSVSRSAVCALRDFLIDLDMGYGFR